MKTNENKTHNEASLNASESLEWLINQNPLINNLIEKFDLEICIKPKSKKSRNKNIIERLSI
ncbi:MAG: hypothetical protein A2046_05310 [Bacteroidetes bacterium GWA2_30_7]|nr:MAG: hypothetical protein A2046_05310 [Bacteroidetes bacterium GWA2_30_7]